VGLSGGGTTANGVSFAAKRTKTTKKDESFFVIFVFFVVRF